MHGQGKNFTKGDKVFFDTNIIVYAYDISDKKKHEKAVEIVENCLENWNKCYKHTGFARIFCYINEEDT